MSAYADDLALAQRLADLADAVTMPRFGGAAVRAVAEKKWGQMLALQSPHIVTIPIAEALREPKRVDVTHDTMLTARATGISFGD